MATAFKRDQSFLRAAFIKIIAPPLGAHKRPTAFQSAKQRGWWFAVGIHTWHGRTGAQPKGWKTDVKVTTANGVFRYWNSNPASVFIQGYRQQRMHFGVWRREGDAVKQFMPIAQNRIRETWRTVTDIRAGVKR